MDELDTILEPDALRSILGMDASPLEILTPLVHNVLKHTVAAYTDFYVFENVVLVLNGIEPDVRQVQGCSAQQIWYALEQIKQIYSNGAELEHPEYAEEVIAYIRFTFLEEGIKVMPDVVEGQDKAYVELVKNMATNGPFPLTGDSEESVQAIKYLKILTYLESN